MKPLATKVNMGKYITATELSQFRRPTGRGSGWEWDEEGVAKYCKNMGYVMPQLSKSEHKSQ